MWPELVLNPQRWGDEQFRTLKIAALTTRPQGLPFWFLLCPQLRRGNFHIWIPHGKIADTFFFLSELSPFLELCPFENIRMKSDACHILLTVHARVLKFRIWIPHGKIAVPYVFSCLSYIPFRSYTPLKKSEWNLVSKVSGKVFELGAWNLVSW